MLGVLLGVEQPLVSKTTLDCHFDLPRPRVLFSELFSILSSAQFLLKFVNGMTYSHLNEQHLLFAIGLYFFQDMNRSISPSLGLQEFTCVTCNKRYFHASNLRGHNQIHTGKRRFSCQSCDKSFSRASHLCQHELIHTGDRKSLCQICSKTFTQESSLRYHMLIHTGERRFICLICERGFIRSSYLHQHEVTNVPFRSTRLYHSLVTFPIVIPV